ncbi:MAG: single-stranded DNA-binding protein, partial [Chloroflexota bacterium]
RRAYVEGRLQSRTFEGSDGQPRFRIEIVANQVLFLDRPQAAPTGAGEEAVEGEHPEGQTVEPDDLPF